MLSKNKSETKIVPPALTATQDNATNAAFVPAPSAVPTAPDPASTEATPAGVTARTRRLSVSATIIVPPPVTAMPAAPENKALVPAPFAKPVVVPPASTRTGA
jgi:hypothetical protein